MKKRSIVVVSPWGTRMRSLRVPLWVTLTLVFMVVAGFVGYFTPLDRLIMTEQELAQKQSLEDQNERLRNNIGATLKLLTTLRERTVRMQESRERYKEVIGLPPDSPRPSAMRRNAPETRMSPSDVLAHVSECERLIERFVAAAASGRQSLFDTIPVTRPVDRSHSIISRRFGMARDPFTSMQKMHFGVDLAAGIGTPVVAAASGVVIRTENDPVWGRRIMIAHGRNFRTVYAHLDAIKVSVGRVVRRGEEIGTVGMSGLTTGAHLHYEVLQNDRQLNPEEFFFPEWIAVWGDNGR